MVAVALTAPSRLEDLDDITRLAARIEEACSRASTCIARLIAADTLDRLQSAVATRSC